VKVSAAILAAIAAIGIVAALLVPIVIYRSGTKALPIWGDIASPGLLSAAHAFLGAQCESCHTPDIGIKAASCITCHTPDAFVLAKQSTAFHATIQECRGCHIEHQGTSIRPVRIDHSVLTTVGVRAAHAGEISGQPASGGLTATRHFLEGVTGNGPATDVAALDCASCHGFRDKHQEWFGTQCADCHATDTWKISLYLHPSPKSQECNECHKAPPSHYMMHFTMMDIGMTGQNGARVEQCFMCHQTDSFNDIRGIGWRKMH
jgi:hypothetical protein